MGNLWEGTDANVKLDNRKCSIRHERARTAFTEAKNAVAGLTAGEARLRRVLTSYAACYNQVRTHLLLRKKKPLHRRIEHHCRPSNLFRPAPPLCSDVLF